MNSKTYSIFGAGAAGLYTAWRLLDGRSNSDKAIRKGDTIELYDWGRYDFSEKHKGSRAAGGRVCTWHYGDNKEQSYVELGGMRYCDWDGTENGAGHRIVTTVIAELGLKKYAVAFNDAANPLFYIHEKNLYWEQLKQNDPAFHNEEFYSDATVHIRNQRNTKVANSANRTVAADFDVLEPPHEHAAPFLKEGFTTGTNYKTLSKGFSFLFDTLFDEIVILAKKKGVHFEYYPNTRLHSILEIDGIINYSIAIRGKPDKKFATKTTHAAWLAMPRYAIDLVAQTTREESYRGVDVLNHRRVQEYLATALIQPSCKVGMFFDTPWWNTEAQTPPPYPAQPLSYGITVDVLRSLASEGFPKTYLRQIAHSETLANATFESANAFINSIEECIAKRLNDSQKELLLSIARRNTAGPSYTDLPIREVMYFGNNALEQDGKNVYGLLANYDDDMETSFWQEFGEVPLSENCQPLIGPRPAPEVMIRLLRQQLAAIHFGPQADYSMVPMPLEARYMDWSLPPFNAGHHVFAKDCNAADVQRKIRKPSQLMEHKDIPVFIVGEAYSNQQAWVEGAFCTAESVLNDFFGIKPIVDNRIYPFIG